MQRQHGRVSEDLQTIGHKEAARLLQIHPDRLYRLARAGQIPCIRLGRSIRYRVSALREWMEQQEKEAVKNGPAAG